MHYQGGFRILAKGRIGMASSTIAAFISVFTAASSNLRCKVDSALFDLKPSVLSFVRVDFLFQRVGAFEFGRF